MNAASVDRTQCLQISNRSCLQSGALPSELKPLGWFVAGRLRIVGYVEGSLRPRVLRGVGA